MSDMEIAAELYFPTPIYVMEKPEFLHSVSIVSEESLAKKRAEQQLNEEFPVYMSDSYEDDPRISEFAEFVGKSAWSILDNQGYYTDNLEVFFSGMWTQEHHRNSLMEQHVHGHGQQIVGFYFLEVPDKAPAVLFYDPRAYKIMGDLRERDPTQVTVASKMINFKPKPGLLILTNSWLAHSFGKNMSSEPFKFVHINVNVRQAREPEVEIV